MQAGCHAENLTLALAAETAQQLLFSLGETMHQVPGDKQAPDIAQAFPWHSPLGNPHRPDK